MFQDVHVVVFVGSALLLSYMRHYGYSSIGMSFLMCAIALQWATITTGIFNFFAIAHVRSLLPDGVPKPPYKFAIGLTSMIGADFAAAAVVVAFGVLVGRTSPLQQLVITLIECICYSANEALNVLLLQAQDPGGSMQIHVFGTYYGLAVSLMLYRKRTNSARVTKNPSHLSNMMVMFGTLFLWVLWPSFNALGVSHDSRYRAIANTYYAMSSCTMASFALSRLLSRQNKFSMEHIQNSTLAGGVALGACCHMVLSPWAAVFIGCCAAVVSVVGFLYITPFMERRLYTVDSSNVHNLHGLPGIVSAIAATIAAGIAGHSSSNGFIDYENSLYTVFPARAPKAVGNVLLGNCSLTDDELMLGVVCGQGRSAASQAGFQLALLATSLAISIGGGCVAGMLSRLPVMESPDDVDQYNDDVFWILPAGDEGGDPSNKYSVMTSDMTTQADIVMLTPILSHSNGAPLGHARAASIVTHIDCRM